MPIEAILNKLGEIFVGHLVFLQVVRGIFHCRPCKLLRRFNGPPLDLLHLALPCSARLQQLLSEDRLLLLPTLFLVLCPVAALLAASTLHLRPAHHALYRSFARRRNRPWIHSRWRSALLQHVGQLVRQQRLPARAGGAVLALLEEDVLPGGEGAGAEILVELVRLGIGMHAHAA